MKVIILIAVSALGIIPAPQKATLTGEFTPAGSIKESATQIDRSLPEEGYVLQVEKEKVHIRAGSEAGIFYALKTLEQQKNNSGQYAVGTIEDFPLPERQ